MSKKGQAKDPTKNAQRKPSSQKWFVENVLSLAVALLIVFMIRSSVFEAFKIPSGSMIPTLLIGDHIFVNKFAYGFHLPFSEQVLDQPLQLIKRNPPKRGDIIVFLYPKDESFHYIKRVVGVPGDTIEIRNKVLYVNEQLIGREPLPTAQTEKMLKALDDPKYSPSTMEVYSEKMDQTQHFMMVDKNNFVGENHGPILVPADSLFVMGDNRDFSNDSRFWGFVPMKNVRGKAMIIWISFNLSDGQFTFRPERIGTILH